VSSDPFIYNKRGFGLSTRRDTGSCHLNSGSRPRNSPAVLAPAAQVAARGLGARSRPPTWQALLVFKGEYRVKVASADLEDELQLDGHVERKLSGAEGQSGVAASLAEDLYQKIGRTVEHLRLLSKPFGGRDMS